MFDARARLRARIEDRSAVLGVVGLGYVVPPLAVEMARSGYRTLGFDVGERVVGGSEKGEVAFRTFPPPWSRLGFRKDCRGHDGSLAALGVRRDQHLRSHAALRRSW